MSEPAISSSFGAPGAHRLLLRMVLLALLCGVLQAVLPRYDIGADQLSPLSVVLGVAVAAAATRGRWMVPAVLVGVIAAEWATKVWFRHAVLDVAAIAAQAVLAGWLLRHSRDAQLLNLDNAARLRRFVLVVAPATALLGALMYALAQALFTQAPWQILPVGAFARLVADWTGIVVAAPVLFCWLAHPPEAWRHRRAILALPLVAVSAMMLLGFAEVARRDDARLKVRFDRDAEARYKRIEAELPSALDALEGLRGALIAGGGSLPPALFDELTGGWIARWPGIVGMGWLEPAPKQGLRAAEPPKPGEALVDPSALAADSTGFVLRRYHGEAVGAFTALAGVDAARINALTVPVVRHGVAKALAAARPTVGEAFRLDGKNRVGVLIAQTLPAADGAEHVAFAVVDVDRLLARAIPAGSDFVTTCLTDAEKGVALPRLAGPPGCDSEAVAPDARLLNARLTLGDRRLNLLIVQSPEADSRVLTAVWLLALPTVIGIAVLSALLLDISGRLRRIEDRVRERTAALSAEVDERRRAQLALADSEQRFRAIFDAVNIGVTLVDNDGRIVMANPAFRAMTGYTEDQLRERPLADIRLPDVATDDGTAAALAGDSARRQRYLTQDGRVLQVAASVHVLRDAAGNPSGTVGALQDLTDMLRLREAEREGEHAQAANRAKTEFLSRLSHELRTPLNAIIGFAQMLSATDEGQADPHAQQRALAQIRQAGWHLLDMINDVLDLSRIEAGELRLAPEALSLTEAAHEAFAMVEPIALQAGVSLRSRLHEDATLIQADRVRLRQVLLNLLGNGVKYNRRGGFVELRSSPDAPGMLLIEVEDNGIGMSDLQQAELFVPFNRLGRDERVAAGTGIGLVICLRLVEAMGGEMRVVSREGEGSTFSLRLPRGRASDSAAPPRTATAAGMLHSNVSIGRVVYIEDHAADVEVMRGWLKQRPGIDLVCVGTGAQGLAQAPTADLVMLDLDLPDMPGLDLLRALKADPQTRDTPVIVVSADALPARIDECFDAGALQYLTKPVDVQQLLRAIDDALRAA